MLDVRDTLERAAWTFAQAFVSALLLVPVAAWDKKAILAAALAGVAAVLSLVKTVAVNRLKR